MSSTAKQRKADEILIKKANDLFRGRPFIKHFEPKDPESRVRLRIKKVGFKRAGCCGKVRKNVGKNDDDVPKAFSYLFFGTTTRFWEVRATAAAQMKCSEYLPEFTPEQYSDYCKLAKENGGFQGRAFIQAVADAYHVHIMDICFNESFSSFETFPSTFRYKKRIYVSTGPAGMDALVPLGAPQLNEV